MKRIVECELTSSSLILAEVPDGWNPREFWGNPGARDPSVSIVLATRAGLEWVYGGIYSSPFARSDRVFFRWDETLKMIVPK